MSVISVLFVVIVNVVVQNDHSHGLYFLNIFYYLYFGHCFHHRYHYLYLLLIITYEFITISLTIIVINITVTVINIIIELACYKA